MKSLKIFRFFLIAGFAAVTFTSCLNDAYNAVQIDSAAGFDYKTTKDVNVTVTTLNNANQPIDGVHVKLYTQNPLNADGTLKDDNENYLIFTGTTNLNGQFDCHVSPAATTDSITVLVDRIGLPQLQTMKIGSSDMNIVIGGTSTSSNIKAKVAGVIEGEDNNKISSDGNSKQQELPSPTIINGFYTIGNWDNQGVPKYLTVPGDVISNSLMSDLTATLPEYKSLLTTHPTFLDDSNDGTIKLFEDAVRSPLSPGFRMVVS